MGAPADSGPQAREKEVEAEPGVAGVFGEGCEHSVGRCLPRGARGQGC
jgi:hypothetical protein